jgi:trk system potassium uptake protein TrkA
MKFGVIGLGSFGLNIARMLTELKHEVLAVDHDHDKIEAVKSDVAHAVRMESADKENLRAVGLRDLDVVIVALGPKMEASILTVLYLHELGVRRIMAKALSEDHAKILSSIGATEVIYPEKDMAARTAHRLSFPNVIEYLPLPSGIGIQEIRPPEKFIGKSLRELDLTNRYRIQVLAVKPPGQEPMSFVPKADQVIGAGDSLVIMGPANRMNELSSS